MRCIALIFAALLGATVLPGCNTMEGFGQDLETLGDKIESKARKEKHD